MKPPVDDDIKKPIDEPLIKPPIDDNIKPPIDDIIKKPIDDNIKSIDEMKQLYASLTPKHKEKIKSLCNYKKLVRMINNNIDMIDSLFI